MFKGPMLLYIAMFGSMHELEDNKVLIAALSVIVYIGFLMLDKMFGFCDN